MSTKITIGSQVITIPGSGADPNWSQGIIDAITALSVQIAGIASTFDIPPSVQVLTNDANTNLDVNSGVFPSDLVRSFVFSYAVYRTNGVTSIAEEGTVAGVYNTLTSTWSLTHTFGGIREADGTPYTSFSMSGDQLQISTVAIGGSYDTVNSKLSYSAKTILVSDL